MHILSKCKSFEANRLFSIKRKNQLDRMSLRVASLRLSILPRWFCFIAQL